MAKLLKTLRNHWKKTAVAVCALGWGVNWMHNRHRDDLLRRTACQEAQVFGNQLLPVTAKVKKATVFLNPAACKGKARNLFEKNAAPILHLAGLDVTVVKTDYEGQAKKLLELMEDTDMIVVAGGDGTLQEVITGLLRREDEATFSKIPIGFIPLGKMNSLSQALYPTSKEQVRHILNATLAIVKGETVPLDVLEIKGDKDRPVFAVTGLRWGAYRDAASKLSKYWYLGPLKDKACHLFSVFKTWPPTRQASIAYLGPTERPPEQSEENRPRPSLWQRILKRLELYWVTPREVTLDLVKPEHWEEVEKPAVEVTISTLNKHADLKRTEDAMNICIEPDTISKRQFVTTGSQKLNDPHSCPEGSHTFRASVCKLQLPKETEGFFSIDNEDYEAVSVDIKLLPRKLKFFCDSNKSQLQ
ncbi:acylglycerol kinase, mitochondrial isoform X2 [Hypanus sabinus]|uniref:acylglycerol kinase, mitochondrial isoform X2 n=1 Tax=Hypanus sabinus TaxID=79690 RepID=UPI0028C405FF|nr:acylglycerol kinase, mitochondrial isoform X2 [Hypanus sabinus]